jgi:ankyrin repeat protein
MSDEEHDYPWWTMANSGYDFQPWQYAAAVALIYTFYSLVNAAKRSNQPTKGKSAVEKQTEASKDAGGWHSLVFCQPPDRKAIFEMVNKDPSSIQSRGPVGETICHFLLLLSPPGDKYAEERTQICKDLIEKFPSAILDEYCEQPYVGENLLHIAIVNRNTEMVKWLVEKQPELMKGRATGTFFSMGSNKSVKATDSNGKGLAYFGESPLSFAASTNQANIVEYLIDQGADMLMQDANGNNVLHMCVIWQLQQMYEFVQAQAAIQIGKESDKIEEAEKVDLKKNKNKKDNTFQRIKKQGSSFAQVMGVRQVEDEDEVLSRKARLSRFAQEKNNMAEGGLTCLTLAAWRDDTIMFDWLLENSRQLQWSYGTVSCYLIPLEEIDWIRGSGMGAIEWIVDMGHREFFKSKRIKKLIKLKWERFGEKIFLQRLEKATVFMLGFSYMIVFDMGVYSSMGEMVFISALELVMFFGTIQKLHEEIIEIMNEGIDVYLLPRSLIENACSFCTCASFVLMFISRHSFQSMVLEHALRVLIAISGWTYMFWFLLGNRRTGHFVVMIFKMIYQDVIPFSIFTSVFLVMFSMIFFLMFEPNRSFEAYTKHVVSCFDGVIGNVGVESFSDTNDDLSLIVTIIPRIFLVFFTIMCIILLNLLVAMMGDTYGEISQDADLEWQRERAGIIFSIEQNMSDEDRAHPEHKYWVDVTVKKDGKEVVERFLQVEEENLGAFDEFVTKESLERDMREKKEQEMLEAMRTKEEIEHLKAEAVEAERKEKNIARVNGNWKSMTTAGRLPHNSPKTSVSTAGGASGDGGELREMQKRLEVKLEVMMKMMSAEIHTSLDALSKKMTGSNAVPGATGDNNNMSVVVANQSSVAAQAKLEAKLDLFASTTTELMKKNAELEARVMAMQKNTPIRRGLSLRNTPNRITSAPPTPLGESSLFAASPGSPQ